MTNPIALYNILQLCALFAVTHFLNTSEDIPLSNVQPKSTLLSLHSPKFLYCIRFQNGASIKYLCIINTPKVQEPNECPLKCFIEGVDVISVQKKALNLF